MLHVNRNFHRMSTASQVLTKSKVFCSNLQMFIRYKSGKLNDDR